MKTGDLLFALFFFVIVTSYTTAWRREPRCDIFGDWHRSCQWVWGSCTRTCGGGTQIPRVTRRQGECGFCNLPPRRSCNTHCCRVNCAWQSWGSWQSCSASCGSGTSIRRRLFLPASCGGSPCSGPNTESRPCSNGCCRVNCQWGNWTPYGPCSATCGSGTRERTRSVSVRASCGGSSCSGSSRDTDRCSTQCCPVNCDLGNWSEYGVCSRSCGVGTKQRTRSISVVQSCGGSPCRGDLNENVACNIQPCPVDCRWSAWSQWKGCSVTCGGGSQSRDRYVVVPKLHGGRECIGSNSMSRTCNNVCCPVGCVWTQWTGWDACSKTCGKGSQSRHRRIQIANSCGGVSCQGGATEERFCNDVCCPVDCQLSQWSKWEVCNVTCGTGSQSRSRSIAQQEFCSGNLCRGHMREMQACNTHCCPVDCKMNQWSPWSPCSATCGPSGVTARQRTVANPATCGGANCPEEREQMKACNRVCLNNGTMRNENCMCTQEWSGECCLEDVNECIASIHDCDTHATCTNMIGSFHCRCNNGFTGEGKNCENLNECDLEQHNCDSNARCVDWEGSYNCLCKDGFFGDGILCTDVDECVTDPCGANTKCSNIPGSYICSCKDGFKLENCSDIDKNCNRREMETSGKILCEDVNECETSLHDCHEDATCTNVIGSFECHCDDGFTGDGRQCRNLNECALNLHNCDLNAWCIDRNGTYDCECQDGFIGDGIFCTDVDECETDPCGENTECSNNPGSFMCSCKIGFKLENCSKTGGRCRASETEGSSADMLKSSADDKSNGIILCKDIDECLTSSHNCHEDAMCTNVIGSFECHCKDGFSGDGRNCQNFNECALEIHNCDSNAWCVDMEGSYDCECNDGFIGNGIACTDVDECAANPCGENTNCTNIPGSFICSCKEGFKPEKFSEIDGNCSGSGAEMSEFSGINNSQKIKIISCEDINECMTSSHDCHEDATCKNVIGSFECSCNIGFTGDGKNCLNFNECALELHNCDSNAWCVDQEGSYNCECKDGFIGDGILCTDVDECVTDPCGENTECKNIPGSFICFCKTGFKRKNCSETDRNCIKDRTEASGYPGDHKPNKMVLCEDIDECEAGPCGENTECRNIPGSFMCSCKKGFYAKQCSSFGRNCTEAEVESSGSSDNSSDKSGEISCTDINECMMSSHNCHEDATCTNVIGSFECRCNQGFTGNGRKCQNINECDLALHNCDSNAECVDQVGSYGCECKNGFIGDGIICSDVDECLSDPCGENTKCSNIPGSFMCSCKEGYKTENQSNQTGAIQCKEDVSGATSHTGSEVKIKWQLPVIIAAAVLAILLLAMLVFLVCKKRKVFNRANIHWISKDIALMANSSKKTVAADTINDDQL